MLVGAPAQGETIVAGVQFQTVTCEDREDGVQVAVAVHPVDLQAQRGQRPCRRLIDQLKVCRGRVSTVDQSLDQAEHRLSERLRVS